MLKRMLGPMVMERARRGWMPTSSVEYKCVWITVNTNCVENSIPKFRTAGSYVPLFCWLSSPIMDLFFVIAPDLTSTNLWSVLGCSTFGHYYFRFCLRAALKMDFQNRPGAKTGGGGAATQGMADRWQPFPRNYVVDLRSYVACLI